MSRGRRGVPILAFFVALLVGGNARGEDVTVAARWSLDTERTPHAHVIKLKLSGAGSQRRFAITPALQDPDSYELRVKSGAVEDVVAVIPSAEELFNPDDPDADPSERGMAGTVTLALDSHVPRTDAEYTVSVKGGVIEIVVDGQRSVLPPQSVTLNPKDLEINQTFLSPMTVQSKLEVAGGSDGGVFQARLDYGMNRLADSDWLNLEVRGTADVNFQASEREEFFNSLTGEVKFFHARLWDIFHLLQQGRYVEIDAHGRIESDQTFDNADALGGLRVSAYTKDPISGFLSTLFVHRDPQTLLPEEAVVSPLITFACDYVSEVADDRDEPGAASKPDTGDGGNVRLDGGLYWSMPLARGFAVQGPNAFGAIASLFSGPFGGSTPDIDALFEVHGWYDAASEKFFDQTQISLAFSRRAPGRLKTSVVVGWARGEAAPNFDEISTLLAGLRLGF